MRIVQLIVGTVLIMAGVLGFIASLPAIRAADVASGGFSQLMGRIVAVCAFVGSGVWFIKGGKKSPPDGGTKTDG
jgi:hypothetical protein